MRSPAAATPRCSSTTAPNTASTAPGAHRLIPKPRNSPAPARWSCCVARSAPDDAQSIRATLLMRGRWRRRRDRRRRLGTGSLIADASGARVGREVVAAPVSACGAIVIGTDEVLALIGSDPGGVFGGKVTMAIDVHRKSGRGEKSDQ